MDLNEQTPLLSFWVDDFEIQFIYVEFHVDLAEMREVFFEHILMKNSWNNSEKFRVSYSLQISDKIPC